MQPSCEGRTQAVVADDFRFRAVPCHRQVALITWTDAKGDVHRACRDHRRQVMRSFPVGDWTPSELAAGYGK